jgi:translation initiation factor IF-1
MERNANFKVRLESGHVVKARCGGRMNRFKIKCGVGDRVALESSPYDPTRARITFRWPSQKVSV